MLNQIVRLSLIGVLPDDNLEEKLQKQFLIFLALFMSMGGIIWGSISFSFQLYAQGCIPYAYTFISIFNLLYFYLTKRFNVVKNIQTGISLLLPFFFQWSLGGFAASGAIMFWAILALLASITFQSKGTSFFWLGAFILFTLISGYFDDFFRTLKPEILADFSLPFLITNLTIIPSIVFGLMLYVVKKQELTQRILYQKQEEIMLQNNDLQLSEEKLKQNYEELNAINEELSQHKDNLEQLVNERTQTLKENEEKLRVSLENAQETNSHLIQAEEELKQNIEELRATEEQMRLAKNQAEHANKAKSEFLANMSHEIRTPLNAIVGFSQILLKQANDKNLPTDFLQNLNHIKTGGQNLSELINNILDLSKIESGKMTVSIEPINIKQLFKGIYHINKGKAAEQQLEFSYDLDESIPEAIKCDRTKLNQILMNLVGNAVKFTPAGKSVRMTATREKSYIVFKIIDTGIGIPENKKPIIFDAFEQADTTITRKFGGSGLGLAITKRMVTLLEGQVGFESELGKGTTFFVKLPLVESNESVLENSEYNFSGARFAKDNVILAAEDNSMNRDMLKSFFKQLGLEVHFAINGRIAIEKAKELLPDIILMDMHMPEMGGIAATKKLRKMEAFKDLPIIALSADAFDEQQREAISQGLTDYITKPIDFKKLMPILQKFLRLDEPANAPEQTDNNWGTLTHDQQDEINEQLAVLAKVPIFNFEEIDEQIAKIKQLANGHSADLVNVLKQVEDACFAGDEEQVAELLKFRL